ncbi:quinolinate synthase NadA [Methanopyrus sp. SNP6]|uniref:quinolinate synthase NadA n=1 Tax=Methanopyrus sp. SNP6 TaxID=1937005 RepID=UPI0011E5E3E0|nr:quinolinate synthase NadA [Methanopyrus sp. SNP6]
METFVLAHNYQRPDVQLMADCVGDSLEMALEAREIDADRIVMCGVDFMAEVVKALNPDREVVVPDHRAACGMAMRLRVEELREFRREHPDAAVVAYVNTSAEVKAEADVMCTSANAVEVVSSLPEDKIIFVPDGNLAAWVQKHVPDKEIIPFPEHGSCPVHHSLSPSDLRELCSRHPDAAVVVHPECPPEVCAMADFVGSTSQIRRYCEKENISKIVMGTEEGLAFRIRRETGTEVIVPGHMVCADMKINTGEKVERVLEARHVPKPLIVELDSDLISQVEEIVEEMFRLTR